MPQRTIKSVYFAYINDKGSHVTARRGETVDVPEGRFLDRGDKLGAFVVPVDAEGSPFPESMPGGEPVPVPPNDDSTPVLVDAEAVLAGNVDEVLAYGKEHPETVASLLEAEAAGKNRNGVIEGLTKLTEA